MMFLYNIALHIYALGVKIAGLISPKAKLWHAGRVRLLERISKEVSHDKPIVWVHVASLGEFEQGRPIIEKIRERGEDCQILLTFFSPSGYEVRRNYEGADYVYYLPHDTPENVSQFLDIVKPQIAIFIKYEYWLNYLRGLRERGVRTFIVSAIFREKSIFFKPWGGAWRNALRTFERIFTQDEGSRKLLSAWGYHNVTVAGDTRFDRVWDIAKSTKQLPLIEQFKGGSKLFVAGSTWQPDEEALMSIIQKYPDVKFVIAPHEIGVARVNGIVDRFAPRAVKYSTFHGEESQILILDTMGMLSSVYKYGEWGYIGGGFGVGIHNTLEATIFGLPIAFGLNYKKFKEARDLVSLGVAQPISSGEELESWFSKFCCCDKLRDETSQNARDFMARHRGATSIIIDTIFPKS